VQPFQLVHLELKVGWLMGLSFLGNLIGVDSVRRQSFKVTTLQLVLVRDLNVIQNRGIALKLDHTALASQGR